MTIRTLITGAGGLVGSALVAHLQSKGQEVICLTTRDQCDLTIPSDVTSAFKFVRPSHVYHLAASVYGVGGNLAFPGEVYYRNVLMNTHIIENSKKFNINKIVVMGSAAMYSDGLQQPMVESDVMAGVPHNSEFSYAYSKRSMLAQLMAYKQQYGLEFAFVIATNMYGPKDKFDVNYGHVVPSLLQKFLNAEKDRSLVSVWGDGSPTRDFLFSSDAAQGLELIMKSGSGVYNLASGHTHTIKELVIEISKNFPGVSYNWDISKPFGQLSRSYDVRKLQALNFVPNFSLSDGVQQTAKWLRLQS